MKSLFFLAAIAVLMSVALASGHSGIHVKIPLPFIKIRFVDIAHLFGGHGGGHGGFELGGHGHGGGFGISLGGGGGHGHHGW